MFFQTILGSSPTFRQAKPSTQYPDPLGSCLQGAEAYSTCHEIMYAGEYLKGVITNVA